jgi:hypothetical protein
LGAELELRFLNGALDVARIYRGDLVRRTGDPGRDKMVRPYVGPAAPVFKQAVVVRVTAREGAPLVTEWRVGAVASGRIVEGPV